MTDISCGICRDLMPLVKDGIAGEDSRAAVEAHIALCETCRALYEAPQRQDDGSAAFSALRRKLRLSCALLMMLCIFVGMDLTGSQGLFYNALLMPLIGALAFPVFRWKALYDLPLLLAAVGVTTCGLNLLRGLNDLRLIDLLPWTAIYTLFAYLGVAVAALLCFALKKED